MGGVTGANLAMVGQALPTSKSVLPTVVTKKGTDYTKFALSDVKSRKSGERKKEREGEEENV